MLLLLHTFFLAHAEPLHEPRTLILGARYVGMLLVVAYMWFISQKCKEMTRPVGIRPKAGNSSSFRFFLRGGYKILCKSLCFCVQYRYMIYCTNYLRYIFSRKEAFPVTQRI
ncbi:hypothetical protein V8F20_000976 [Naviculisporaceae sp. PSN 640]